MLAADVYEELDFADLRARELRAAHDAGTFGHPPSTRNRLTSEFFFHLATAAEFAAQFVNTRADLGIHAQDVSVKRVARELEARELHPLAETVRGMYVDVRNEEWPEDPYSDRGYLYRLWN